jgi:hypothetical protein
VEEWGDTDKGIVVSRTIADGDLINDDMNSDAESKSRENESSEEEIVTVKMYWAKPVDAYSTLLKFADR